MSAPPENRRAVWSWWIAAALLALVATVAAVLLLTADEETQGAAPLERPMAHEPRSMATPPALPSVEPAPPEALVPEPVAEVETLEAHRIPERAEEPRSATTPALVVIVLDENDRPVADAEVLLTGPERRVRNVECVIRTNAAGRCRLGAPLEGDRLVARHPVAGTSGVVDPELLQADVTDGGDAVVVLHRRARLTVTVLHADGTRDTDAWVSVLGLSHSFPGAPEQQAVDGRGQLALEVDGAQLLVVEAFHEPRHLSETVSEMLVIPPGTDRDLTLRFPLEWTIEGQVVDRQGEPATGAHLTVWRQLSDAPSGTPAQPREQAWRDSAGVSEGGAFSVRLPGGGSWWVQASGDSWAPGEVQSVHLDDRSPTAYVTLVLEPAWAIEGLLVDGTGLPLPDVTVHARPAHVYSAAAEQAGPTIFARMGQADGDTAADGSFRLEPLHPDGVYIVWCRPDESQGDRKLVVTGVAAGTEDLLLVANEESLARAVLEGLILEADTGLPIERIEATLVIDLDGEVRDTRRPAQEAAGGRLRIEGLAPGFRYALRIDAPGRGAVELPWFIAQPGVERVDASLPPSGQLCVEARSEFGAPLPLATIEVWRSGGFPLQRSLISRRADERGAAFFDDLDPGLHVVRIKHGGRQAESEAAVESGREVQTQVYLDR